MLLTFFRLLLGFVCLEVHVFDASSCNFVDIPHVAMQLLIALDFVFRVIITFVMFVGQFREKFNNID